MNNAIRFDWRATHPQHFWPMVTYRQNGSHQIGWLRNPTKSSKNVVVHGLRSRRQSLASSPLVLSWTLTEIRNVCVHALTPANLIVLI